MMQQTSIRLPQYLLDVADAVARETAASREVPALNRSEAIRLLAKRTADAIVDVEDASDLDHDLDLDETTLRDLVPESDRVLYQRERYKDGEGHVQSLRSSIEERIRRHYRDRFANGWSADGLDEWRSNMRADVRILFARDEDAERREELLDLVDAVADRAVEREESSDYSPTDVEGLFEDVEHGQLSGEAETLSHKQQRDADDLDDPEEIEPPEDLVDDAITLLDKGAQWPPRRVESALAARVDVDEDLATRAVDDAIEQTDSDREPERDDVAPETTSIDPEEIKDVFDDGTIATGDGPDIPDNSRDPEEIEPPVDVVEEALDALDDNASAVVPTLLEARIGVDHAVAVAARDEAIRRRRGDRGDLQEAVSDD